MNAFFYWIKWAAWTCAAAAVMLIGFSVWFRMEDREAARLRAEHEAVNPKSDSVLPPWLVRHLDGRKAVLTSVQAPVMVLGAEHHIFSVRVKQPWGAWEPETLVASYADEAEPTVLDIKAFITRAAVKRMEMLSNGESVAAFDEVMRNMVGPPAWREVADMQAR